jgi:adenosylmethionine-8-amino-7-oxononanoate aminotransferase
VTPDIVCVGKALSAGYLTLAATLCGAHVATAIEASESGVLMHGPTYMANPLACAVANASLDLLDEANALGAVSDLEGWLATGLEPAHDLPGVAEVRTIGAVGVIQLDRPADVALATRAALDHGVWIRPFRDLIYVMPPYISEPTDIAQICTAMFAAAKVSAG